jgi:hypothetical protein
MTTTFKAGDLNELSDYDLLCQVTGDLYMHVCEEIENLSEAGLANICALANKHLTKEDLLKHYTRYLVPLSSSDVTDMMARDEIIKACEGRGINTLGKNVPDMKGALLGLYKDIENRLHEEDELQKYGLLTRDEITKISKKGAKAKLTEYKVTVHMKGENHMSNT